MRSDATKTAERYVDHGVSTTVPSRLVRRSRTASSGVRSSRYIERPSRCAYVVAPSERMKLYAALLECSRIARTPASRARSVLGEAASCATPASSSFVSSHAKSISLSVCPSTSACRSGDT